MAGPTFRHHQGQPDQSGPNLARQAELRSACQTNITKGKPPCAGVKISTLGELHWILNDRGWVTDPTVIGAKRPDFRYADFAGSDLAGANLYMSDFSFANLHAANLRNTYLVGARLHGANLSDADLDSADLSRANLERADLQRAVLTDAHFYLANMGGAKLNGSVRGHALPTTDEPTAERRAELEAIYHNNVANGRAPYLGCAVRTRGELEWILRERGWAGTHDTGSRERANLTGIDLETANLGDIQLGRADLSYASMFRVNLSGAYLQRTDLSGANLREADLSGSILAGARMDTATGLVGAIVDSETRLADVVWNGATLTQVDWSKVPILGDEQAFKRAARTRAERLIAYRDTARAYRGLAVALHGQGVTRPASEYRLRQLRYERKVLFLQGDVIVWFISLLLDALAGYGERLRQTFRAYGVAIALFAVLFYSLSLHSGQTQVLSPYESVVLSISSFHGRGFFPSSTNLGDPLAGVAAAEAIIGLLIEATFIATLSRRFFVE